MIFTRSSWAWYSFARADDRVELGEVADLQAEMVERRRGERRIGGEQVYELAERAGVHDQGIERLSGVVAFDPAEDLAEEVEQIRAPAIVENLRVHADRDVIERRTFAHACSLMSVPP